MELHERLAKARKAAGFTQRTIANKLGIERTRYCHWENGRSAIPTEYIVALCDEFGCTADFLLGRVDGAHEYKIEKPAELADYGVESVVKHGSDQLTPDEVEAIRRMLQAQTEVD